MKPEANFEPSRKDLLVKNRTEEIGADVFRHFVVPPFYDQLSLETARKPRVIEGGRGSGKTMLLRYLSHQSAFSPHRDSIPASALHHIGLYWKADTQFAQLMRGRGHDDALWQTAFEHLLALVIGEEILVSLNSIASSTCATLTPADLDQVSLADLSDYETSLGGSFRDSFKLFRRLARQFASWTANADRLPPPQFLPGRSFLQTLLTTLTEQLPSLRSAVFFVYIDEYENLQPAQQRIINTYIKHSEAPLIINIALKRNAMADSRTTGPESLSDVADYRKFNIEDLLADDFNTFAAEVLLLSLSNEGERIPFDLALLRDPLRLSHRREEAYRRRVLGFAQALLPGLSEREQAEAALADSAIRKLLERRIKKALDARQSLIPAAAFIRSTQPVASITASALVSRPRLQPKEVLAELDLLDQGRPNRFTGTTDWNHNNFIGALLPLYEPHGRIATFYAGFDAYLKLSRTNLRHFLELCYRAYTRVSGDSWKGSRNTDPTTAETSIRSVPPVDQAEASRETSAVFLAQVKSFGSMGIQLHTFVLRLGALFSLAHKRPTQSEPEISHFAILRGTRPLSTEESLFLDEAEKWSVLLRDEETKAKSETNAAAFEYVLNPIYAPYFNISYRKRRKLDLTIEEFATLHNGSYDNFAELLTRFRTRWNVNSEDMSPSLFGNLVGTDS